MLLCSQRCFVSYATVQPARLQKYVQRSSRRGFIMSATVRPALTSRRVFKGKDKEKLENNTRHLTTSYQRCRNAKDMRHFGQKSIAQTRYGRFTVALCISDDKHIQRIAAGDSQSRMERCTSTNRRPELRCQEQEAWP